MPRKNTIKSYRDNGNYHVYNRGTNRTAIFLDQQDYAVYLGYIKEYLSPPPKIPHTRTIVINGKEIDVPSPSRKNFYEQIQLLCYCLMPNHFHFLVHQSHSLGIAHFMSALATRYVMYFNKRHQRSGTLFESRYKAVIADTPEQLLHLSRYIHLNPLKTHKDSPLRKGLSLVKKPTLTQLLRSQPSSYPDYLGKQHTSWLFTTTISKAFSDSLISKARYPTYGQFIEAYPESVPNLFPDLVLDS